MPNRYFKTYILSTLLLCLSLLTPAVMMAQDKDSFNIAEFHQILDSINQADIPDNVKDRLFQDLKNSMIENVRMAEIPEDVKRTLIKDLESTSR